jgi:zinc and cadmium transporter
LQTAISFIAGLMLGIALLHLIPHAAEETHSVDCAVALTLGGFLMMFFLQRIFHYHQHGIAEDPAALGSDHVACCGHSPALVADLEILHPATSKLSWMADCLGLGFHSLLDGLALESMVAGK